MSSLDKIYFSDTLLKQRNYDASVQAIQKELWTSTNAKPHSG